MVAWLGAVPVILFGAAATVSVAAGNVAAGLVAVAALVVVVVRRGARELWPPREILLALGAVYLTHALATALAAPAPVRWEKLVEEMWLKSLLVTVPLAAAGRPRVVRAGVLATVAVGALTALYALWQTASGHDLVRDRPLLHTAGHAIATGFHSHHLSYGGQVMLTLVVAMVWLRSSLLAGWRGAGWPLAACLVLGLGLIVSFARSAQLGAFVAAVMLVPTLPGRWRRAGVGVLVAILVLAAALPAVRLRVIEGFTDEKEVTRPNLWRSSVAGIADRPLRGWGAGNFGVMMAEHEHPGYYEVRAHAHNDYLMHAVNAGLPGLLAALWLLWATIRHLHAGWRRGGAGSWILLAAVTCQVAIATAGIFQVYQTDDEPEMLLYYLIGCGLALLASSPQRTAREA